MRLTETTEVIESKVCIVCEDHESLNKQNICLRCLEELGVTEWSRMVTNHLVQQL